MASLVQSTSPRRQPDASTGALARGLGWFSIALGVAEVLAPRALARTLGMDGSEALLRAYGLREIATGVGILAARDPAPWIWGRVGGDALDIATLATGLNDDNPQKQNVGLALAAVAGVTLLDVACVQALSNGAPRPIRDYSNRSGLPRPPEVMRGAARDFKVPRDMRIPEAMRPFTGN
jgi:hypothetical protein